jgi:hypothetical protein
MERRKIVVISGSGRTGSTLLSLLLSQHRDVFNLGQLRDLWSAWRADAPCSCGHRLRACPVYGVALKRLFGAEADGGTEAMRQAMQAFFADAGRTADWNDASRLAALGANHAATLDRLGALIDVLAELTGAKAFVDASKSPEMALALSLAPGTQVEVLNLARDPRAVARSWQARRGSLGAAFKYARVWARRQRVLGRWAGSLGGRFKTLRYEDFTAAPRSEVEAAAAWAGLPLEPGLFVSGSEARLSWERQHLYPPANERVLAERREQAVIAPSEDWRDPRHGLSHLVALIGSHPEGLRYIRGAPSS